jgi:predicted kinase
MNMQRSGSGRDGFEARSLPAPGPQRPTGVCHVVCGAPASGKTFVARQLARELRACLLDSDVVSSRLVAAGMTLAGLDPDDRDSEAYKAAFRSHVYEAVFDIALDNLSASPSMPVVLAAPFTQERRDASWPVRLTQRLGGADVVLHYVTCDDAVRRTRMTDRGEARDASKLVSDAAWAAHVATCAKTPPVWPHTCHATSS